jgi:sulfate adenylyltransferase
MISKNRFDIGLPGTAFQSHLTSEPQNYSRDGLHLIAPHGGELVDLMLNPEIALELKAHSRDFPSWDLTSRQIRDLELLIGGGFSPLRGFMNRCEYDRVCDEMRLSNGLIWPIPITLDVPEAFARSLKPREQQDRAA